MAGTLTIAVKLVGSPSGPDTLTVQIPITNSIIFQWPNFQIGPGTTGLSLPPGVTVLHYTPPAGNTVPYQIGTITGHKTQPTLLALDPSVTTISMSATPAVVGGWLRLY